MTFATLALCAGLTGCVALLGDFTTGPAELDGGEEDASTALADGGGEEPPPAVDGDSAGEAGARVEGVDGSGGGDDSGSDSGERDKSSGSSGDGGPIGDGGADGGDAAVRLLCCKVENGQYTCTGEDQNITVNCGAVVGSACTADAPQWSEAVSGSVGACVF